MTRRYRYDCEDGIDEASWEAAMLDLDTFPVVVAPDAPAATEKPRSNDDDESARRAS